MAKRVQLLCKSPFHTQQDNRAIVLVHPERSATTPHMQMLTTRPVLSLDPAPTYWTHELTSAIDHRRAGTNDTHSKFDPYTVAATGEELGGVMRRVQRIEQLREVRSLVTVMW
jgi:hypothetical protein